jgi:hypothetical protein
MKTITTLLLWMVLLTSGTLVAKDNFYYDGVMDTLNILTGRDEEKPKSITVDSYILYSKINTKNPLRVVFEYIYASNLGADVVLTEDDRIVFLVTQELEAIKRLTEDLRKANFEELKLSKMKNMTLKTVPIEQYLPREFQTIKAISATKQQKTLMLKDQRLSKEDIAKFYPEFLQTDAKQYGHIVTRVVGASKLKKEGVSAEKIKPRTMRKEIERVENIGRLKALQLKIDKQITARTLTDTSSFSQIAASVYSDGYLKKDRLHLGAKHYKIGDKITKKYKISYFNSQNGVVVLEELKI